MIEFSIHGVRGTMPACGEDFLRHGGNTTCFRLETDECTILFDAGSGICSAGEVLASRAEVKPVFIAFSHFHIDHLLGLPTFKPLYDCRFEVCLMGDGARDHDWRDTLRSFMGRPLWPVCLDDLPSAVRFRSLNGGHKGMTIGGADIFWCPTTHPQSCIAFRIAAEGKVIVIATDHEAGDAEADRRLLEFCRGADILLFDAQYTPAEYDTHRGWGHSTWRHAVEVASAAGAGRLVLTHHDPLRTDSQLDQIVELARAEFPRTSAGAEGEVLLASAAVPCVDALA